MLHKGVMKLQSSVYSNLPHTHTILQCCKAMFTILCHTHTIIYSVKNKIGLWKKCEIRRKKLTLVKIYLFAHGRWRVFQVNECKTICSNSEKCEEYIVQCHEVVFVTIWKNVKKMLCNVLKWCCEGI
jgi:hypothetical protein